MSAAGQEVTMRFLATILFILVAIFATGDARAQSPTASAPSPESLAAAREMIQAMKATDQFKALLPIIIANMKSTVVQNRPEMEKAYDAMMPALTQAATARMNQFTDQIAAIYANHFSVAELHDITAFFQTPTGQKLTAEQAGIARETMAIGRQFGRSLAADIQAQALDALQKQGGAH
jgi:hypothetical protein